ncbi:MAG: hypothetical protein KGI33_10300 [Thaumarchaeota archaeon]|nr:hypothetical protein [Nitrososphaerota archaeon]
MVNQIEVSIEVILHATEDGEKIFGPLSDIFKIGEAEFSHERTEGYHGNPIIVSRAILTKRRAEDFVRNLVSRIPPVQIEEVRDNIGMYFEDSSLYLRIGKAEIAGRTISLQQNNAIKVRIKVPIYKKGEAARTYTELLRT